MPILPLDHWGFFQENSIDSRQNPHRQSKRYHP